MNNPKCSFLSVTPAQAQQWLDTAARNRNLSQRRVEMYAAMMKRGDWMLTNQGIAIDEHGALLDGQHRLNAIVKAEIPVTVLVVQNVPNASQLVLDQSLIRRAHDQISLKTGWDVTPRHTATAKEMLKSLSASRTQDVALSDILLIDRFYNTHHKAIEFAISEFAKHPIVQGISIAPVMAPVARSFYSQDRDLIVRFVEIVTTGMSTKKADGAGVVLRNYLLARNTGKNSVRRLTDRRMIYKKTEIALLAFLEGRQIERIGQMVLEAELFLIPGEKAKIVKKSGQRRTASATV